MIKIEIWSDLACPFCYIGKRQLEAALAQFPQRDQVLVNWKSFELDPSGSRTPNVDLYDSLAKKYGRDRQWAIAMTRNVVQSAATVGLQFDMDRVVPTSTFDAHRLIKLADRHGLQDQAEERLFSAYFCEGRNLGDHEVLKTLALEIGLAQDEIDETLKGGGFEPEVRADEAEAQSLGVRGVPFFVFNRKLAVSGAQPVEAFLEALMEASKEGET